METALHEALKFSRIGPSARHHDEESELTTELPSRVNAPAGSFTAGLKTGDAAAAEKRAVMTLRDSGGTSRRANAFLRS